MVTLMFKLKISLNMVVDCSHSRGRQMGNILYCYLEKEQDRIGYLQTNIRFRKHDQCPFKLLYALCLMPYSYSAAIINLLDVDVL